MTVRIITGPDQGDALVVITAAELHPDRVFIDLISVAPKGEVVQGMVDGQPGRFELTDNLGTEYEINGGGGNGYSGVQRLAVSFEPAVPSEATYLRVTTAFGSVVLMI